MKKLLLLVLAIAFYTNSQAQNKIGPAQRKMLDTLCNCMNKVDLTKIKTPDEAEAAFENCFNDHLELLAEVAIEENVDLSTNEGQGKVGSLIGVNLLQEKCASFLRLAGIMAKKKDGESAVETQSTTGAFKRIDVKGFNYIVIASKGSERSYLWLKQFPGSETFMGVTTKLVGSKLKITWQEIEVYLPAAKGYYKVKEIIGVDVL